VSTAAPATKSAIPVAARIWQRFTPTQRLGRFTTYLVAVIAIVWSFRQVEVIPEFLYDAPQQTADLFRRMWPVDWAYYPKGVHEALIETFHIATLGTLLSLILGFPIALLAAKNITKSATLNWIAQFLLVSSRSVNSLIWALLFVAIFGPGAIAGVLAIGFRSIGFVGKLLAEAFEEARPGPIEALVSTGAPAASVLTKGYWPQVEPSFWSVALFRWDINIRESAILGLVGAGGIGVALDSALNNLYWDQVGLILLVIFAIVIATEFVTSFIRSRII
jgi:phosphonate transport system permease protein